MNRTCLRLTERDRAILSEVQRHRVVRRDDLIKLGHFHSIPRCNQRLLQLVQAGFLRRMEGVNGLANHQTLYTPDPSGVSAELRGRSSNDGIESLVQSKAGPILVEHSLRILDFRHELSNECVASGVLLTDWLAEPECHHEFEFRPRLHAPWAFVSIKPDASFELASGCARRRYFLEMDLGHVSLPRFRRKVERYEIYASSGAFRDAYDATDFTLITVTTGEQRLEHLSCLPSRGFQHVLTNWPLIESEGILQTLNGPANMGCTGSTMPRESVCG